MTIFTDENKVKNNFFKFAKVGDEVEGTLVGKRQVPNQLSKTGELQWIYELLTDGEELWNVGSKSAVDVQMRHVKLGQIVGFRYIEERQATRPGMSNTKIIQVFANPKRVNKEWLLQHESELMSGGEVEEGGVVVESENNGVDIEKVFSEEEKKQASSTVLKPGAAVVQNASENPKIAEIAELMKTKFGVTDPITMRTQAMSATGLAFLESNLDKILEKLKALA